MSDEDSAAAVLHRMHEALKSDDMITFFRLMHDDLEVWAPPYVPWGGVHTDYQKFRAGARRGLAEFLDMRRLVIESTVAEGDRACATLRVGITGTDDEVVICEDWTMRDGLGYRVRIYYYDPAPLLERLRRQPGLA